MSKFVILHKKKDTLNRLYCIMKVTKQTLQHLRKKVPLTNTIHYSTFIYNQLKKLNLCKSFSNRVIGHLMSILISIFISGYHGKTTDFAQNSSCHRTTIAHFLWGCWCQWHIISVLQALDDISLSRKDIDWFAVPFSRKSINICFNVQNPVLILKRLWN